MAEKHPDQTAPHFTPPPDATADHTPASDNNTRGKDENAADPNGTGGWLSAFAASGNTVPRTPSEVTRQEERALDRAAGSVPGYVLLSELGRGGMGVVYKARHIKLNRFVALKMVLGDMAARRSELIRFLAEAEAVAAVKHPNVVEVYDYGEADDRPFMALEYLPGGDLADLFEKAREAVSSTSARDAATLLSQIAHGVAAAHALGIVHRDLKPGNVLLSEAGVPKVADFGLAKRGDGSDVTQTGQVMGTPAYMSPEQAKGETKFVGPQADVWALGAILYEALTGTRPFLGTLQETLAKVMLAHPVPPRKLAPAIPRDLELICLKCLAKLPHERYPTAKELADDLDRYLSGLPVTARPVGALTQAAKWVRRNPILAGLFAAIVFGSIGIAAFALIARDNANKRANAERDKAEEERKRADAEFGASLAVAMQENKLTQVVELVKTAERKGMLVPPESQFAAAAALAALGRTAEAEARFRALVGSADLPPALRARAELWLADMLFGSDDAYAQQLLRSARDSGQLSPADLEFATALEAKSIPIAIDHLLKATRHDPSHFPARRMLLTCLVVSARFDEAVRVGEGSRLISRDHPETLWGLLLAYGYKGDTEHTREIFALLRPFIQPDLVQQVEMIAKYLPVLSAQFRASTGAGPPPIGDLYKELEKNGGARTVMSPQKATAVLRDSILTRVPPLFRDAMDDYLEFVMFYSNPFPGDYAAILAGDDVKLNRLKTNMDRRPEGFMLYVYALALTDKTLAYLGTHGVKTPEHLKQFRDLALSAADAYRRAAESPALIDVQSVALEAAAIGYSFAARPQGVSEADADHALYRKGAEMVRRRLALAEPVPTSRLELLTRVCRNARDLTTARRLLEEWEKQTPNDLMLFTRRAEIESLGEAYLPALNAARDGLRLAPTNAKLKQLEADCLARLGFDPDHIAPPPREVGK